MLGNRVVVYVPELAGTGLTEEREGLIVMGKRLLTAYCGWYEVRSVVRGYCDVAHRVYESPATALIGWHGNWHDQVERAMESYAGEVARTLGVEAVGLEIHGALRFVTADHEVRTHPTLQTLVS